MIQGVIFDMDGLMFDTERIWATLWEPALAGLGLSYKEGLDEAARGTAGDSMRAVLRRFYGPDCDPDRIIEALHKQGETAFLAPPPKKPGLDEILAWLDERHIPMVVASSSRMASIRHHLDGWGCMRCGYCIFYFGIHFTPIFAHIFCINLIINKDCFEIN